MNIDYLTEDELLVELEIRSLIDSNNREVTDALKGTLGELLLTERDQPFTIPVKPHKNAAKNPRHEAENCKQRLIRIQEDLLTHSTVDEHTEEELLELQTKALHVQGRLNRIAGSKILKSYLPDLFKSYQILAGVIKELSMKGTTLNESRKQIYGLVLPNIIPEQIVEEGEDDNPKLNDSDGKSDEKSREDHFKNLPGPSTSKVSLTEDQSELIESLKKWRADIDQKLSKLSIQEPGGEVKPEPLGTPICGEPHQISSLHAPDDFRGVDPRVCKDISAWDLKFEGMRSSLHVERFFYRVERLATKSRIPLAQLVDYLSMCLSGEAREWYWVHLERNPHITWNQLKQEMIQRFQASRTDDDVRRLLNQRKQLYPRESFQEYYDGILRIALQAQQPYTDGDLYRILRRNMRPGLQLELHDNQTFHTLSQFIKKCVSLEDMWLRVGHNPEATISSQRFSAPQYGDKQPARYYSNNGMRPPFRAVAEVCQEPSLEMDEEEFNGATSYQDPEAGEVFAIDYPRQQQPPKLGNQPQSHKPVGPTPPITIWKRAEGAPKPIGVTKSNGCWNCGNPEHIFFNCRQPVTQVFCYGCGTKGVFKPDCTFCKIRSENYKPEMRNWRDTHASEAKTYPKQQEEVASNTDPELYRRQQK